MARHPRRLEVSDVEVAVRGSSAAQRSRGVGAVVRVRAKSALPYHMFFEVEAVREEPPRLTEARVRGDLNGTMKWAL